MATDVGASSIGDYTPGDGSVGRRAGAPSAPAFSTGGGSTQTTDYLNRGFDTTRVELVSWTNRGSAPDHDVGAEYPYNYGDVVDKVYKALP